MEIIAHRGASGDAPENTLAAFRLAFEQQADGIECDVHLSRDEQIMVHHDRTTGRVAGKDLSIADSDSADLRQLDVGRWKADRYIGERIPLLMEVLALMPAGKRILVEIKCGPEIISPLARVLSSFHQAPFDIDIISFHLPVLLACRETLPDMPCYLVNETLSPGPDETCLRYSSELIKLAQRQGFAGLDLDYSALDADFVAAVKAADLGMLSWTMNDPAWLERLRIWGVDGITTDWPALMRVP